MNSEMLISVVVPVYNAERFLDNLIGCVRAQTYPNWELILVDDCSTDNSLKLCREWSEKDNRIRVVAHTKNGGPQSSRTDGIAAARGDYVGFMDTDDFIHPRMYEVLAEFARRTNAAIVQGPYLYRKEEYSAPVFSYVDIDAMRSEIIDVNSIYARMFSEHQDLECFPYIVLWNKIMRADYAKRFEVRFNGGSDTYFAYQVYTVAGKMTVIEGETLYYYTERPGSVSHRGLTRSHIGVLRSYFSMEKDLFDRHSEGHRYAVIHLSKKLLLFRFKAKNTPLKGEFDQVLKKELPSYKKRIWKTKELSLRMRASLNSMLTFPFVYSLYKKYREK